LSDSKEEIAMAEREVVIVAIDMCSSTSIIEDLTRTHSVDRFELLLKKLQSWLSLNSNKYCNYEIYKFTGDGWILIFPTDSLHKNVLMKFLIQLSKRYYLYQKMCIVKHLESFPKTKGLTFGIDTGLIYEIKLNNKCEYIGRPLNVACRLQNAVKDKCDSPDYNIFVSVKVFNNFLDETEDFQFKNETCELKNISGGENYRCKKIDLSLKVRNM
jgi:class 3 adenylate cyclase